MKISLLIFDLDGTLYSFDNAQETTFTTSRFYTEIKKNAYAFFQQRYGIEESAARQLYEEIKRDFKGEVSIGVEARLKIDRYEFFKATWNIDPQTMLQQRDLTPLLSSLDTEIAIRTAAPRVWAEQVLDYLNLSAYTSRLFTGEPDIRKPNPQVFQNVCTALGKRTEETISIGDQVATDILPAKSLGMKTILMGASAPEADRCIKSLEELPQAIQELKND